ncbi:hypothetical protein [Metakosakonia massiliensis]
MTEQDKDKLYAQVMNDFIHCLDDYQTSIKKQLIEAAKKSFRHAVFPVALLAVQVENFIEEAFKNKNTRKPGFEATECPLNKQYSIRYGYGGFDENIENDDAFIPFKEMPFTLINGAGKEILAGKFNDKGESAVFGGINDCEEYFLIVNPDVTPNDYKKWLESYQPLISTLQGWLDSTWKDPKMQASWKAYLALDLKGQVDAENDAVIQGISDGALNLLKGTYELADDIVSLTPVGVTWNYIYDVAGTKAGLPARRVNLHDKLQTMDKEDIERTWENLKKIGTAVQDDALVYLFYRAVLAWIDLLPPVERKNINGQILFEILSLAVTTICTAGIGTAVKGASTLNKITSPYVRKAFESLLKLCRSPLVAATLSLSAATLTRTRIPVRFGRSAHLSAEGSHWVLEARQSTRAHHTFTTLTKKADNAVDSPPVNGRPANDTATTADPVSMVNGEELLLLDDVALSGLLPFSFSRLYRTACVGDNCGLGYGWSHSLNHHLTFDNEFAYWNDHEGRVVTLPIPEEAAPHVENPLAGSVLYLTQEGHYVAGSAGSPLQYVFIRDGDTARLAYVQDKYRNTLVLHRSTEGQVIRLVPATQQGLALLFTWKERCIQQVDLARYDTSCGEWLPVSTPARYRYNQQEQLVSVENTAGETEHYLYDAQHVICRRELAGGAVFQWEWDGEGKQARCIRHWGNFGQLDVRYQWDSEKGLGTLINQDGTKEIYHHDKTSSLLLSKTTADGSTTEYRYNAHGKKIAERDGSGHVTHYQYDDSDQLTEIVYPDGRTVTFRHQLGRVVQVEEGQRVWRYEYNAQGDVILAINPLQQETHYRYNERGQCTEVRYPDGAVHTREWGREGELLAECRPDGQVRRYAHDALLRVTSVTDGEGHVTGYRYDDAGRVACITFPDGATREYRYNAYGKVTWFKDEAGKVTTYDYAAPLHLLTKKTLPDGSTLRYRYDNDHLQVSDIFNQKGERYRLRYTPGGLLSEEVGFDNVRTTYHYDAAGRLSEKREYGNRHDEAPFITRYERNSTGKLTRKTLPDGQEEYFHYDAWGQLIKVSDTQGNVLAWEYNSAGQLTAEHTPVATQRYGYDELTGELTSHRLPDGQRVEYRYINGQLRGITLDDAPLVALRYDNTGRINERHQGNLLTTRYGYDARGRLAGQQLKEVHDEAFHPRTLFTQAYRYTPDGELASAEGHQARRWHYDATGRLTAAEWPSPYDTRHAQKTEAFHYDP